MKNLTKRLGPRLLSLHLTKTLGEVWGEQKKQGPSFSVKSVLLLLLQAKPMTQHMFEARGPGGCLLLIEVLTDSSSRSHQEIKRLLNKNGSGWACCYFSLLKTHFDQIFHALSPTVGEVITTQLASQASDT